MVYHCVSLGFLYGGNARPQPSSPPDPVDVPFEMPLTDKFSEYELVKDGDRAGVEAHAQLIERDHLRREDQVACADGGRDGFREAIHIDDVSLRLHREERILRLGEKGKLGIEIIFDDHGMTLTGEAQVLGPLRGRRRDAGGIAVEGRHMEYPRTGADELARFYTALPHPELIDRDPVRPIYLLDLLVGRVFQRIDLSLSKHLYIQSIKVLRARPDQDLLGRDAHMTASCKIGGDRTPQLFAAMVRRRIQDLFSIRGKYASHRARKDGKREKVSFSVLALFCLRAGDIHRAAHRTGICRSVVIHLTEDDEVSASFSRLHVAFLDKKIIGVRHRDEADALRLCGLPLRRKLGSVAIDAIRDGITNGKIKGHVGGHKESPFIIIATSD